MYVPTIQANSQRQIRSRDGIKVALTAVGKDGLLGTKLALQTLSRQCTKPHCGRTQRAAERQGLGEQAGNLAIRDQPLRTCFRDTVIRE